MSEYQHDEEEFTTGFNGHTVLRMLGEVKRYWPQVLLFLVTIAGVAVGDAYNTYLNKRIIDEAIALHDTSRLLSIGLLFASIMLLQSLR
jgi:ABC-type multidrug transport system fused ATPase/permease subunit